MTDGFKDWEPWNGTVPRVTFPILVSDHSKIRGFTTMTWVDEAGDLRTQEIDHSKDGE